MDQYIASVFELMGVQSDSYANILVGLTSSINEMHQSVLQKMNEVEATSQISQKDSLDRSIECVRPPSKSPSPEPVVESEPCENKIAAASNEQLRVADETIQSLKQTIHNLEQEILKYKDDLSNEEKLKSDLKSLEARNQDLIKTIQRMKDVLEKIHKTCVVCDKQCREGVFRNSGWKCSECIGTKCDAKKYLSTHKLDLEPVLKT
eukprot:PhF_6_TR40818/c2_g1_i3/m.61731